MRRVLVTGVTGVLGPAVIDALGAAGDEVVTSARRAGAGVQHVADLTDAVQVARLLDNVAPDAVVHLAGAASGSSEHLYRSNVLSGLRLADACASASVRSRVVLFGSAAEYGDAGRTVLSEIAPLRPVSDYGRSKVAQTVLVPPVLAESGTRWTLLRPFNVVSPRLPARSALGNVRTQLLSARGGRCVLRMGRLDLVRDFVTDRDVGRAVRAVLDGGVEGVLNVCTGRPFQLADVVAAAAELARVEVTTEADPGLKALPAVSHVVGDPGALEALGIALDRSLDDLAAALLRTEG